MVNKRHDNQWPREYSFDAEAELNVLSSNFRDAVQKVKARYEFEEKEFLVNGQTKRYMKASGPRYQLEVELAYLTDEIVRGPKYIAPKHCQAAHFLVDRFIVE